MPHPFLARSFLKYRIIFLALFQSHWKAGNRLGRCCDLKGRSPTAGAFQTGAGTASSLRFVGRTAFYGDEPSPPLLAHFRLLPSSTARPPEPSRFRYHSLARTNITR